MIARSLVLVVLGVGLLPAQAFAEPRTWKSADGVFSIEAELLDIGSKSIKLQKADGSIIEVPLAKISRADRKYVAEVSQQRVGLPPAANARAKLRQAIGQRTNCEFVETPLSDVLDYLASLHQIPIVLDVRSLDDAGLGADRAVSIQLNQVQLSEVLDTILKPIGLTWLVHNEVLFVTTQTRAEQMMDTRVYKINGRVTYDDLVREVTRLITPQQWDEVGGPCSVSPVPGRRLAIAHHDAGHRAIEKQFAEVLDRLDPVEEPAGPADPNRRRTPETALAEAIKFEFIDTPLSDVVAFLKDRFNINIRLDTQALNDEGIGTDAPVTMKLAGISLASGLNLLLQPMGLTWLVEGETLVITTPQAESKKLLVKSYPMRDLGNPRDYPWWESTITSTIAPHAWDSVGGAGDVVPAARKQALQIRQTYQNHRAIARFFAAVRGK